MTFLLNKFPSVTESARDICVHFLKQRVRHSAILLPRGDWRWLIGSSAIRVMVARVSPASLCRSVLATFRGSISASAASIVWHPRTFALWHACAEPAHLYRPPQFRFRSPQD